MLEGLFSTTVSLATELVFEMLEAVTTTSFDEPLSPKVKFGCT